MGEEERKAAEALLDELGIPYSKNPKPTRATFTSKLQPYAEEVVITCRTCGSTRTRHFIFSEQFRQHQFVLMSRPVTPAEYDAHENLPKKVKHTGAKVCKKCAERLAGWSKEELIATLLNIRVGGEYAKITAQSESD
jgi:RNase P subunit RPR2